jgi:hypothetical protein
LRRISRCPALRLRLLTFHNENRNFITASNDDTESEHHQPMMVEGFSWLKSENPCSRHHGLEAARE